MQKLLVTQDQYGSTPLHLAVSHGYDKVVRILLVAGAIRETHDIRGRTPLHMAAEKGRTEVAKILLAWNADVASLTNKRMTSLHMAAMNGHHDIVKLLLQKPVVIMAEDDEGLTALHLAAENGHVEVVRAILGKGVNFRAQDGGKDKMTPLHRAALNGHADVVQLLLDADSSQDVKVRDGDGRTPLHSAVWKGHKEVIEILLKADKSITAAVDKYGRTALHRAAWGGQAKAISMILDANPDIVDIQDNSGMTALSAAADHGYVEVVKLLLARKANFALGDNSNRSPLIHAAWTGKAEIVLLLLGVGANVAARDYGHWTALHGAAQNGHAETINILLNAGAQATAKDKWGRTALDCAKTGAHTTAEEILMERLNATRNTNEEPPKPAVIDPTQLEIERNEVVMLTESFGTFNTNEVRPADQPLAPRNNARRILFAVPYDKPPAVLVGLNEIDMDGTNQMRLRAFADTVRPDGFQIHIETWWNTTLYAAGCIWLQVAAGDPDYQCGLFSTMDDHPWDEPTDFTSRRVEFDVPYDIPPQVMVWLYQFDMNHGRVKAHATDITTTGFTIHIDSWGDTQLLSGKASWVAFPTGKTGVLSGICDIRDSMVEPDPENETFQGKIAFDDGIFLATPHVLIAFNTLDVDNDLQLRLNITTEDVSRSGMIWRIKTWGGTRLKSAKASYIALA